MISLPSHKKHTAKQKIKAVERMTTNAYQKRQGIHGWFFQGKH